MKQVLTVILSLACVLGVPRLTLAAQVFVSVPTDIQIQGTPEISFEVGRGYDLAAKINTEDTTINTISGVLKVPQALSVTSINHSQSIVNLWVERPQTGTNNIQFSGAIRGGYNGSDGLLFTLSVAATDASSETINFPTVQLYANDGLGTAVATSVKEVKVVVGQSLTSDTSPTSISPVGGQIPRAIPTDEKAVPKDTQKPRLFTPLLGKQPDSMGGMWFIAFDASDEGSGIKGFEVKEGEGPFVPATSPYVLKDQTLSGKIIVRAIDQSGNVTESTVDTDLSSSPGLGKYWPLLALAVLILGIEAWRIFQEIGRLHQLGAIRR